jgi:N utilization substance protein A
VRDAERELIYAEFQERKGEIASGIARRVERGAIVVDLGRTEAFLPQREQIPGEIFKPGDRIQGYIADVRQTPRGPQIIMSRADERYLMKLFEMEVPEIYDEVVEIKAAAREPGSRAKIAVSSKDPSVDPVGACVGMKGSRVQNIVQELKGEKIDIVEWDEDQTRFVCNALAPAEVAKVIIDETAREMEIVVPDGQLSLAIGKKGQNVRLAAKLTGWKLDILSETKVQAKTQEAIFNLMLIPGISETMAQNIYQSGFPSLQDIERATPTDLVAIPGYDLERAAKLKETVSEVLKSYADSGKPIPGAPVAEGGVVRTGGTSAKSLAEERLKMELRAAGVAAAADASAAAPDAPSDLLTLRGVGESTVEHLKAAGVLTIADLAAKSVEELTAIEGIGAARAEELKTEADKVLKS